MPKVFRVVIPVSDLSLGIKFYTAVLGLDGKQVSSGRYYFDCGGVILCIYDPKLDGDQFDEVPMPTPIYISVSGLSAFYARALSAHAVDVSSIQTRPWGERSFYAKDPFGNPLCFVDERTVFQGQFRVN